MSAADAGGPAFPVDNVVQRDEKGYLVGCEISSAGMTLRDYFAAKALQGMLSDLPKTLYGLDWQEKTVQSAYSIADAMLEARK